MENTNINDNGLISTVNIANIYNRGHYSIIRKVENYIKKGLRKGYVFQKAFYTDTRNRQQPMYMVNTKLFRKLVMSLTGDKADTMRDDILDALDFLTDQGQYQNQTESDNNSKESNKGKKTTDKATPDNTTQALIDSAKAWKTVLTSEIKGYFAYATENGFIQLTNNGYTEFTRCVSRLLNNGIKELAHVSATDNNKAKKGTTRKDLSLSQLQYLINHKQQTIEILSRGILNGSSYDNIWAGVMTLFNEKVIFPTIDKNETETIEAIKATDEDQELEAIIKTNNERVQAIDQTGVTCSYDNYIYSDKTETKATFTLDNGEWVKINVEPLFTNDNTTDGKDGREQKEFEAKTTAKYSKNEDSMQFEMGLRAELFDGLRKKMTEAKIKKAVDTFAEKQKEYEAECTRRDAIWAELNSIFVEIDRDKQAGSSFAYEFYSKTYSPEPDSNSSDSESEYCDERFASDMYHNVRSGIRFNEKGRPDDYGCFDEYGNDCYKERV